MKNPLREFLQRMALRKARSTVPTSLLPMRQIRRAVVFVDAQLPDEDPAVAARIAQRLLSDRGIEVSILCPGREDLDWVGRVKPDSRPAPGADLYLSLSGSPDSFTAAYEARCSDARFKVGRYPLSGDVFDLVVASPGPTGPEDQAEALPAILEILDKIQ